MKLAVIAALLSACTPTLSEYGQYTCQLSHAEWSGDGMIDPNDPTRIQWPICVERGVRFSVPPQNPRGDQ
jgi:hypothetical protein